MGENVPVGRPVARALRACALIPLAVAALLALSSCGSDAQDPPRVNSVPAASSTVPASDPPTSGEDPTSGDAGTQGATPGQDGEQLDPPGGTTPVPDPGGDGGGSNGSSEG